MRPCFTNCSPDLLSRFDPVTFLFVTGLYVHQDEESVVSGVQKHYHEMMAVVNCVAEVGRVLVDLSEQNRVQSVHSSTVDIQAVAATDYVRGKRRKRCLWTLVIATITIAVLVPIFIVSFNSNSSDD